MQRAEDYRNERLDYLGIVAWNCLHLPAIESGFLVGCPGPPATTRSQLWYSDGGGK
ncbi:hypothetical protein ccbrp13_03960 [Ktedonobacteria bacterium brp13]|nr:hypothetical protein ccbrp13_03960 [Ktedonobacteria bacterium brp13]